MNTLNIKAVPSSFVYDAMKPSSEVGSGEAKLFIGSRKKEEEYDEFFEFDSEYKYKFNKENMLMYLNQVKMEYVFQKFNKYKDASLETWNANMSSVEKLNDNDLYIHLLKFTDNTRYYIKAEEKNKFLLIRKIIIPKITDLLLKKDEIKKEIVILLNVNYNYQCSDDEDTTSVEHMQIIRYETGYKSDFARNRIFFGAPGTGKSFKLNIESKELLGNNSEKNYERVTFHPDYSYSSFVGTYKPVPTKDKEGKESITYEYVPGPFMRIYVDAIKSGRTTNPKPYLLIVEEINRANVAAVFGDIFQLLDREKNVSAYPIMPSQDVKEYLAKPNVLGGTPEDYNIIKIPDNMFIWATMNSADQGVFPMDTAFKRRWNFTYIGIDDAVNEMSQKIKNKKYKLGNGVNARLVQWNDLRKAINDALSSEPYNINEDKLLGPYFITNSILENDDDNEFVKVFKNKVLMYLFEDAIKQKRRTFFENCKDEVNSVRYSDLCKKFDAKGVFIFPETVSNKFTEKPTHDDVLGASEE